MAKKVKSKKGTKTTTKRRTRSSDIKADAEKVGRVVRDNIQSGVRYVGEKIENVGRNLQRLKGVEPTFRMNYEPFERSVYSNAAFSKAAE